MEMSSASPMEMSLRASVVGAAGVACDDGNPAERPRAEPIGIIMELADGRLTVAAAAERSAFDEGRTSILVPPIGENGLAHPGEDAKGNSARSAADDPRRPKRTSGSARGSAGRPGCRRDRGLTERRSQLASKSRSRGRVGEYAPPQAPARRSRRRRRKMQCGSPEGRRRRLARRRGH